MPNFLGDFPSLWIRHLLLWENAFFGGGKAQHWIGERREPAVWNAEWPFHLSQACHRTDKWSLPACLLVLLKSPSGPSWGLPHPSASGDSRWCCGVKRRLMQGEKICYGTKKTWRSRGLGDWLREGTDEYAFSFSVFAIQAGVSPSELELPGRVQLQMWAREDSFRGRTAGARSPGLCRLQELGVPPEVEAGLLHSPLSSVLFDFFLLFFFPTLLLPYSFIFLF